MSRPTPLKLYGFGPSRSFRALWALEETGLAFEHIEAALRKDATLENSAKHPNYLALNSQGKVPTLVDGDKVLTESVAIVNYIARLAPESKLIPTSVSELARYDELSCFILAELEQPLWSKGKHLFALPEEQRSSCYVRHGGIRMGEGGAQPRRSPRRVRICSWRSV